MTDEDAIAVVGLACRVPGAPSAVDFWRNLLDGVAAVRRFTPDELRTAGVAEHLLADPRYVPAGGHLDGVADFDAEFFGYPAAVAALIDPQQRLFLEVAWSAMEDAGYDPPAAGSVGVFAGASVNRYFLTQLYANPAAGEPVAPGDWEGLVPPGHTADYLPLRVSHKLGLTGPSVAVQAACASSLVAVCFAAQSLLDYRCDLAIAGGASVTAAEPAGYLAREGGLLSPDGVLRPFDAAATGTVYGSGAGAVVLKRLIDLAQDDQVYAVLRGWAVTNDGAARAGFATPGVSGLAAAVVEALAGADLRPADVGYLEAHGSGTPVGDAIEVRALAQAFDGTPAGACLLGSVKANIGNLDAAAGVVGLIKAVLAVRHGLIPATPHVSAPHPDLDLAGGPFQIALATQPWPARDGPRRAGVNAIGLGGTNVHVIVEEPAPRLACAPDGGYRVLPLSARTPEALREATDRLAAHLRGEPSADVADVAYTLCTGRRAFGVRAAVVARDAAQAAELLARPLRGQVTPDAGLALLFGEADGYPQAPARYATDPVFRRHLDECAAVLVAVAGRDPRTDLAAADPLVGFAVGYALAAQLAGYGLRPRAVAGSGAGRYAAAWAAGAVDLPGAVAALVAGRVPVEVPEAVGAAWAVPVLAGPAPPAGVRLASETGAAPTPALDGTDGPYAALAACWVHGLAPDWAAVFAGRPGRRVSLPGYPFQRRRHWMAR